MTKKALPTARFIPLCLLYFILSFKGAELHGVGTKKLQLVKKNAKHVLILDFRIMYQDLIHEFVNLEKDCFKSYL